jgi:hypothetical protein
MVDGILIQHYSTKETFDKYNQRIIERMDGLIHCPKPECATPFFLEG